MIFSKFIGKSVGFLGYALQYACLTHCTFEYVGDFVMVSLSLYAKVNLLLTYSNLTLVLFLVLQFCFDNFSAPDRQWNQH